MNATTSGICADLAHFVDRGLIWAQFTVQTIFGILGGIGADMRNLMFMKETADRLFGRDYHWSVLAAGRFQIPFATQAAMMGGNVRVGLEDSLFIGRGKLATSNAEQVAKIRRILEELGHSMATVTEAREMLALKGGDQVEDLDDVQIKRGKGTCDSKMRTRCKTGLCSL